MAKTKKDERPVKWEDNYGYDTPQIEVPEKKMLVALLKRSMEDIGLKNRTWRHARKDSIDYLLGTGEYRTPEAKLYPFHVERVCEQLDLYYPALRAKTLAILETNRH